MCTYHPKSPERICHLEKKKNENKVSLFSTGWAHKDGATIQAFYKVRRKAPPIFITEKVLKFCLTIQIQFHISAV